MSTQSFKPSAIGALIRAGVTLPSHFVVQCNRRIVAAALSSKLSRLDYTCIVSEDNKLEARGVQRSRSDGYEVPNNPAQTRHD